MSGRGGRLHRGNLQTPQVAGEDAARLLKTHDPEARRPEARVPKAHDPEARRLEARVPEEARAQEARVQEARAQEARVQEANVQEARLRTGARLRSRTIRRNSRARNRVSSRHQLRWSNKGFYRSVENIGASDCGRS